MPMLAAASGVGKVISTGLSLDVAESIMVPVGRFRLVVNDGRMCLPLLGVLLCFVDDGQHQSGDGREG